MASEFETEMDRVKKSLADQADRAILAFFGDLQTALKYMHLYVVEHTPLQMEVTTDYDFTSHNVHLRAESHMRIRPKTQKELEEQYRD